MELQPRLFDDLPPTREETPVHQLNYPTFAGAENTMWHGRRRDSEWYGGESGGVTPGWNPEGEGTAHVGTFEAASERVLGSTAKREAVSPRGQHTPTDTYRPREELMEASARVPVQMLPFRVRDDAMFNTPDDPVSDAYANLASGESSGFDDYEETYINELLEAGQISEEQWEESQEFGFDPEEVYGDRYPEPISMTGGLYYKNTHEDPGSVSAVVPEASDLQHWPTEVMEHSTNPAQRRTAEFLLGRGY